MGNSGRSQRKAALLSSQSSTWAVRAVQREGRTQGAGTGLQTQAGSGSALQVKNRVLSQSPPPPEAVPLHDSAFG